MIAFPSYLFVGVSVLLHLLNEGAGEELGTYQDVRPIKPVKPRQNAKIYASPTKEGIRIEYSPDPDWSDLSDILSKNGIKKIASVCVTGPWIMYRNVQYDSKSSQDYSIVSGGDNCIQPGMILSMQPLGSADTPFRESVTFFTQKHFGSHGFPITSRRGKKYFDSLEGPVKSLIVVGRSQWTLIDTKGKSFCLATNFDAVERLPICLVPDVFETAFAKALDIATIHKGCSQDVKIEMVITLEDCSYFGERRPDPNDKNGYIPRVLSKNMRNPSNDTDINSEEKGKSMDAKYEIECPGDETKEFITLLTVRLNHDFGNINQLLWPGTAEDVWKTEILDITWDIALQIIPSIVPQEYLLMMREFMVYHLSLVWKHSGDQTNMFNEGMTENLKEDLEACSSIMIERGEFYALGNEAAFLSDAPKAIFIQFNRDPTMDIIIDTTYLIANMVLGVCHNEFGFANNFWANFIYVFNKMYLHPLVEDWKTIRLEDQFVLGGYDYESQYQRLAIFASTAIELIPNLEPFQRPDMYKKH